jgi:hypothetical protein
MHPGHYHHHHHHHHYTACAATATVLQPDQTSRVNSFQSLLPSIHVFYFVKHVHLCGVNREWKVRVPYHAYNTPPNAKAYVHTA